ncbi:hypothetical protein C8R45DRAFT_955504 [Mycena sanguinolenta]|nr:hypothetical protein C8R45DRAFT_955504 [Mycena sanguinolenta]
MHRCLQVLEIVDLICAEMDPYSYPNHWLSSSRDLAVLARTCTSFCGPALRHLWARATLGKLITSCMPPDLWVKRRVNGVLGPIPTSRPQVELLRTIRASDWARVEFYGRLVKQLSSGTEYWSLSGVLPALSVSLPHRLFPNLQILHWNHSKDDFHYIHHFLRPTISKISLIPSSDANLSLFSTLATKCPGLLVISVSTAGHDNLEKAVSEFVRSLQYVQKLYVPSLDQTALEHISCLTTLNELMSSSLPEVSALTLISHSLTFPALRRLTLNYPDIGSTTQFLGWCSGVPLLRFHASFWGVVMGNEMDSFFATVSAAFLPSSLTHLSIACDCENLELSDPTLIQSPFNRFGASSASSI